MNVEHLLGEIAQTRIFLARSAIHGIGVIALAEIPAGTTNLFHNSAEKWPAVPLAATRNMPAHVQKLIETYCLKDEEHAYLPPHGFQLIDLAIFLNHSDTPNLRQMDGGNYFVTLRAITAGEELTIDYGTLEIETSASVTLRSE